MKLCLPDHIINGKEYCRSLTSDVSTRYVQQPKFLWTSIRYCLGSDHKGKSLSSVQGFLDEYEVIEFDSDLEKSLVKKYSPKQMEVIDEIGVSLFHNWNNWFDQLIEDMSDSYRIEYYKTLFSCPDCNGKLTVKQGRFGKFLGCTNFPSCRHTENASLLNEKIAFKIALEQYFQEHNIKI